MKIRLLLALVGLAIGFALPTFAQQTNTPDPQLRQRYLALVKKYDDALNKNDAAAVAALFTEDAVFVTDGGPVNGRPAIEVASNPTVSTSGFILRAEIIAFHCGEAQDQSSMPGDVCNHNFLSRR